MNPGLTLLLVFGIGVPALRILIETVIYLEWLLARLRSQNCGISSQRHSLPQRANFELYPTFMGIVPLSAPQFLQWF